MSLFDPQQFIVGLLGKFGLSPEHMQRTMVMLGTELENFGAEKAAFKAGAAQVVTHFNARFDAIDARLARIESVLIALTPTRILQQLSSNGVDHDGRT